MQDEELNNNVRESGIKRNIQKNKSLIEQKSLKLVEIS